jgi:hypothetical protein
VVGVKHQCRSITQEDLLQPEMETVNEPTEFLLGQQRFYELLVEVMGA